MSMGESKAATVMHLAVEGEAVWNLSLVQLAMPVKTTAIKFD